MSVRYKGHAYVISASDNSTVLDLGDYLINYTTYNSLPPTQSEMITNNTSYYETYLGDDFSQFGGTVVSASVISLANWIPQFSLHTISTVASSSYKLKITFDNGKYLISQQGLNWNTNNPLFYGYSANDVLEYTIVINACRAVDIQTQLPVVNYIIDGATLDDSTHLYSVFTGATSTTAAQHQGRNDQSSRLASVKGFFANITPYVPATDPYAPGGPSGPGGGGGTFTDTPDQIPFSTAPAISATDTGFCTLFATNIAGIQSVAAKLWTDLFDAIKPGGSLEGTVEALKSLVTSPYDAILGCTILPFHVNTTTAKSVKLYGVLDCGVSLPVAASQWQIINCGYLDIEGTLKSYLDYSPYTKVTSIFLPYIGTVSIDVDAIMDKRLTIQYMVDILSGQCIAQIMIDNAVQAQYQGHCAVNVPVTSIDWSTTVNAGLGLVGNVANIVGSAAGGLAVSAAGLGAAAGAIAGQLPSMAQNVMGSKPDIKSGGGVGGAAGQMGGQKPVLIIERPRQSTPGIDTDDDGTVDLWQNHWTGYPSNIAVNLGTLEGYTEVARIFVNRTNATAEEKQEIERLLMEGVYF